MTWDEALKMACEELGWIERHTGIMHEPHPSGQPRARVWLLEDYALPAYVAELLYAKDIKRNAGHLIIRAARAIYWERDPRDGGTEYGLYSWFMLPPKGRILAALVALGKMTLEQAQGVE